VVPKPRKSPKLTADRRRQLSASDFALPGKDPDVKGAKGTYPIDTPARARAALSKAKANATPARQQVIRKRVAAKWPGIRVSGKSK
jgi:hypothetical protein